MATFNSRGGVSKFPQPVINYYNQLLVSEGAEWIVRAAG